MPRTVLVAAAAVALGLAFRRRRTPDEPRADHSHSEESLRLPRHIQFGAATAAHQVEGGTHNNNWTRWEKVLRPDGRPGIFTAEHCGRAADHWNLFESDLERMKYLGLSVYRFSIEWSRIEPQEGVFDEEAIERYRSWCVMLRDAGITPMVTLHHFTEPLWIADRGGFEDPRTVASFARFVRFVVPRLADVVDLWVTVNEPVVYVVMGWLDGEFPPGKRDGRTAAIVLRHLLLAHAEAYHAIHELDQIDADGDGVPCMAAPAANIVVFEPARRWNPIDRLLARLFDRNYNRACLDALNSGRIHIHVPGLFRLDEQHDRLRGTWDYFGLNHYFRLKAGIRYVHGNRLPLGFEASCEKNDMGWDLTPRSLADALKIAAGYRKAVYITENGACDASVADIRRQRHLLGSLAALQQAVREGADVRAYVYWSLIDNFEWAHGFGPRFGLYRVDYATQERTLTGAARLYRRIIADHRMSDEK